ncbi:MAG TPA: fluoride efflux transporter CrcB [Opitutae bacterium]|nr:fluoride efflux transporter CrcB [Opitutae bacterium]
MLYSSFESSQARYVLILFTAIGCALGGIARYLITSWVTRQFGDGFPWGTLVVNVLGSFLLGCVLGAGISPADSWLSLQRAHAFAAIGFCGGLTTFSTFSLQTLNLVSRQQWGRVAANALGSLALCALCAIAGFMIMEGLTA